MPRPAQWGDKTAEKIIYTVTKAIIIDLSIQKYKQFRLKLDEKARILDEAKIK